MRNLQDYAPRELYKVLIHCRDSPDDQDWCWDNARHINMTYFHYAALEQELLELREQSTSSMFGVSWDELQTRLSEYEQTLREFLRSLD